MEKKNQNLAYWKANASEDYMNTPISVLRYITELESALSMSGVVERSEQLAVLAEWLKDHYSIDIPDRVIDEYKRYNS